MSNVKCDPEVSSSQTLQLEWNKTNEESAHLSSDAVLCLEFIFVGVPTSIDIPSLQSSVRSTHHELGL